MRLIITSALCLFMLGCSSIYTQKGINLNDKSSFITISTNSEKNHTWMAGLDRRIAITSLDGANLFAPRWESDYPETLNIRPGIHRIGVQYKHLNMFSNACLWVDATLGENYIVKQQAKEYSVFFWLENIETHKKVGGICGSEPKN